MKGRVYNVRHKSTDKIVGATEALRRMRRGRSAGNMCRAYGAGRFMYYGPKPSGLG